MLGRVREGEIVLLMGWGSGTMTLGVIRRLTVMIWMCDWDLTIECESLDSDSSQLKGCVMWCQRWAMNLNLHQKMQFDSSKALSAIYESFPKYDFTSYTSRIFESMSNYPPTYRNHHVWFNLGVNGLSEMISECIQGVGLKVLDKPMTHGEVHARKQCYLIEHSKSGHSLDFHMC